MLQHGKATQRSYRFYCELELGTKPVRAELVEAFSQCEQTLEQAQGERLNDQYWVVARNDGKGEVNRLVLRYIFRSC